MKRLLLLIALSFNIIQSYSQSSLENAAHMVSYGYLNYNPPVDSIAQSGPDYGCVTGTRPVWINFYVCGGDTDSTSSIYVNVGGSQIQPVGFIVWGPFDDTVNIASKLTAANIHSCFDGMLGLPPLVYARDLEFGKIYYAMLSMDTAATLTQIYMRSNGYWSDDRCGISNDRVANYKQDICMVTTDTTTQKNMLVWENKYNFQTASFNIYREGVITNQFDSIGNVPVTSTSTFIDNAVNPNQRSYRYIMSAVDSSGHTETVYYPAHDSAEVHATIHLQASPGLQGEANLAWNAYVGFPYNTFYIYRGASATNLSILDSVSSTTFAYTDFTPPPGINYYKVTVHRAGGCSPDGGTTVYIQAISNPPYAMVVGINNPEKSDLILCGPNPFADKILLRSNEEIQHGRVIITNSSGESVYDRVFTGTEHTIEQTFADGVYTLLITGYNVNYVRRIIRQ